MNCGVRQIKADQPSTFLFYLSHGKLGAILFVMLKELSRLVIFFFLDGLLLYLLELVCSLIGFLYIILIRSITRYAHATLGTVFGIFEIYVT